MYVIPNPDNVLKEKYTELTKHISRDPTLLCETGEVRKKQD